MIEQMIIRNYKSIRALNISTQKQYGQSALSRTKNLPFHQPIDRF